MEEENPSFCLNLEFLEPQVEEENEIEQCKTDKEVEEFIKRPGNGEENWGGLQEVYGIHTK